MSEPRRSRRRRRGAFALGLGLVAASLTPTWTTAQMEASAGILVLPEASLGGTQVGPVVSAGVSSGLLGLPLFLEASVGRTDFTSLGQDYHHNHYLFVLGAEWFPTSGATRVGLRLGVGGIRGI